MLKKLMCSSVAACVLMSSGVAIHAGELSSTTSVEDVEVKLTIKPVVWIQDLAEINLGTYDPSSRNGTKTKTETVCVYSNTEGSKFGLTASSAKGATDTAFKLEHTAAGINDKVDYKVEVKSVGGAFEELTYEVEKSDLVGHSESTCEDAEKVSIRVTASGLDAVTSGDYADVLTLTVAPE